MSQLAITKYLNELADLKKVSGAARESVVREAFKDLLKSLGRSHDLVFIPEHQIETAAKAKIYVDGALVYDLRLPFGYWEAKDQDDDLDEEIGKKFAKGYPQDNIIFEDSHTAILIQNRQEVARCPVEDTDKLEKLLDLFFGYERPEIAQFRKAVAQFQTDLPAVLEALRAMIATAQKDNKAFKAGAAKFLKHAQGSINPSVTAEDVREMLIQHILTEEIFSKVFDEDDFHRQNNVARELYALEALFFTGALKKNTLKGLEPYYNAIRATAHQISTHNERQKFLKVIYERFYKTYNPKAADRLGVVYTPQEIVRFMIESADWLCQKHFGKSLIDKGVEILDPATGTGTYICELLEHFRGQPQKLAYKYKEELHANEVAILPYYVANLNIEATYAAIMGTYAEFPNLCFVDTLDNVAGLGMFSGYQPDLFGALSEENVARIKRQNKRKISVIIGNPPYNAWQENFNQGNANRSYVRIDERIRDTYIRRGTAQNKSSVYDMYTRFFRWASDRLHGDGIIAFISNRNYIEKASFDGFRRDVADEFSEVYIVDLGGDVRANPKLSGTKNNVFGIQTGVSIAFFIKKRGFKENRITYLRRPEMDTAEEKLVWLSTNTISTVDCEMLKPDTKGNWLNHSAPDWEQFVPIIDSSNRRKATARMSQSIFQIVSSGLQTKQDDWAFGDRETDVSKKMQFLISAYNIALSKKSPVMAPSIKWHRELDRKRKAGQRLVFQGDKIRNGLYRPFVKRPVYFDRETNSQSFRLHEIFRTDDNKTITFLGVASANPLAALGCANVFDTCLLKNGNGSTQGAPRYRYTSDGSRLDNITDWALDQFRTHYAGKTPSPLAGEGGRRPDEGSAPAEQRRAKRGKATKSSPSGSDPSSALRAPSPARGEGGNPQGEKGSITKDAIFHYVYAVLHDPIYREKYAQNLKREFPRIPFYPDFWRWAEWGDRLMALHIGYETVEPWPLARVDTPHKKARAAGQKPKPILKADADNGIIVLDSETQLAGVPKPAWTYRLGNRSALEWILDQHKEKTPKDPTIREKFNTYRFADYKEKVVDLLMRVTRVSVETMEIVDAMRLAPR